MTALFPDPIRVTLLKSFPYPPTSSPVGLLLGLIWDGEFEAEYRLQGILMLAEGAIIHVPTDAFTVDWRYDVEEDRFVDLNVKPEQGD